MTHCNFIPGASAVEVPLSLVLLSLLPSLMTSSQTADWFLWPVRASKTGFWDFSSAAWTCTWWCWLIGSMRWWCIWLIWLWWLCTGLESGCWCTDPARLSLGLKVDEEEWDSGCIGSPLVHLGYNKTFQIYIFIKMIFTRSYISKLNICAF